MNKTTGDGFEAAPASLQDEREAVAALAETAAAAGAFSGSHADRERLARIMDLLPCYVALIDKQHRIRFHNKAFEQYFGKPDNRPCHIVMRDQQQACRFCPPLEALSNKSTSVMEWVHPRSGHAFRVYSYPFFEENGGPCVLEAGFNITASVRVQQALDLSEQSYRAITDNLSIGIALVDPALRLKTGNTKMSQWFSEGFRLDRQVCWLLQCGAQWNRAIREPGFTCSGCPFKASLEDGAGHEKEITVTLADGKERVMRLVTCPVRSGRPVTAKTKVRAIILMLEDITNRLRVNQQLQRARKLEAMNTLAGGIAHEINQPLSALHLYASGMQMLLEKQGELTPETTQERLSLIMHEAEKIQGIISHMRTLVMQEGTVTLGPVCVRTSVRNVLALMRRQFTERGLSVLADIPDSVPPVYGNELQLEQVLVNLLANAMHAVASPGEGAGETGPAKAGPAVLIRASLLPEGAKVRLEVADSGPGLPQGSERIFDPFFTTKERHEGMGLGLSIVHGIVSLWGGEISAMPRRGALGGAAFYVDLPVAGREKDAPALSPPNGAAPDAGAPVAEAHEPERAPGAQKNAPLPKAPRPRQAPARPGPNVVIRRSKQRTRQAAPADKPTGNPAEKRTEKKEQS